MYWFYIAGVTEMEDESVFEDEKFNSQGITRKDEKSEEFIRIKNTKEIYHKYRDLMIEAKSKKVEFLEAYFENTWQVYQMEVYGLQNGYSKRSK
jgi:uncharacterized membrane-anchored protein